MYLFGGKNNQRWKSSSSRWCYSLGWALASSAIYLQASRFLALSLHSFKPIFLRSMDTSSSHLILGFLFVSLRTAFRTTFFLGGFRCLAFFLYGQAIVFFNKPDNVKDGNHEPEINDRINRARAAITKLNSILWDRDVTTKTKTHMYHATVNSAITCAAETWCLKAKTVAKLNSTEMNFW